MTKRTILLAATLVCIVAVAVAAVRQDWQSAYDAALKAAADGRWADAREKFLSAQAARGGDTNKPISLPGPITEPRLWRDGSPYSPQFGAAYAAYRMGVGTTSAEERNASFDTAERELRALIDNGQVSTPAILTLARIYDLQGNKQARQQLASLQPNFTVDTSFLAPEDRGAAGGSAGNSGGNSVQPIGGGIVNPGEAVADPNGRIIKVKAGQQDDLTRVFGLGPVLTLEKKYALVIGNSKSADPDAAIPYAASDALAIKDALAQYGGYQEDHIILLTDATAAQIREAAHNLAETIPNDSIVTIYFTGVAANLGGRDYFAGVDAEFTTDTSKMVEKLEILRPFIDKGSVIYLFCQVNRQVDGNAFFGQEMLTRGTVSEAQATIPGGSISSIVTNGQQIGLYTYAFCEVLKQFFTNEIPISEFCWNVFYTMRRGTDPRNTGGAVQTPTLPVLTNMSRESRF